MAGNIQEKKTFTNLVIECLSVKCHKILGGISGTIYIVRSTNTASDKNFSIKSYLLLI